MPALPRLRADDRTFFAKLANLVVANPFGREYAALESELFGGPLPPGRTVDLQPIVTARLRTLFGAAEPSLAAVAASDRAVIADVLLFDLYFTWADRFREHIAQQEATPDEPRPLAFGTEIVAHFLRRGFTTEDARRYVGVFFQMRRAYVFVERALAGTSACMQALREALWNNIFTRDIRLYTTFLLERMEDFSTLLLGETGTGKGSAAGAIGRSAFIPYDVERRSFRESFARAFVALNLSEFPESLIESALFGHEKGAFTGAGERREGVFASCSPHGAILLDEIGELSQPVQVKLLRVLQERVYTPVGGRKPRSFRGRVIAATNRDRLHQGPLRDDFFYRLSSDVIVVPPLRQRLAEAPAELEVLVARLVERIVGAAGSELVAPVVDALRREPGASYPWPGNVRELEQAVRRILVKGRYEGDAAGSRTATLPTSDAFTAAFAAGTLDAKRLLAGYCARLHAQLGTYEEVARVTGLDRRTARRYVLLDQAPKPETPERGT